MDAEFDLKITGMHCGGCPPHWPWPRSSVALEAVDVGRARGRFKESLQGQRTRAAERNRAARLYKWTHPVPPEPGVSLAPHPAARIELPVGGMTCAACQAHVEKSLRATAGVTSASVNLVTRSALVDFDPKLTAPKALVEAVRASGYEADLPSSERGVLEAQQADNLALARKKRKASCTGRSSRSSAQR